MVSKARPNSLLLSSYNQKFKSQELGAENHSGPGQPTGSRLQRFTGISGAGPVVRVESWSLHPGFPAPADEDGWVEALARVGLGV